MCFLLWGNPTTASIKASSGSQQKGRVKAIPGSTLKDAIALAEYLNENTINPEQVQDFYPTPTTISTCMYYTGINPRTMRNVYVPRSFKEKAMQRALLQFKDPVNDTLVREALIITNRTDLIGYGKKYLIRPKRSNYKAM